MLPVQNMHRNDNRKTGSPPFKRWHGICNSSAMNNTIYLNTSSPVLEMELTASLEDFQVQTFSLRDDEMKILACPSPRLWIVEINPRNLRGLLFVKNLIEERGEPVIVLSWENSGPVREECYLMGVDDFVEQPWYPRVIAMRVRAVLGRRHAAEGEKDEIQWFYEGTEFALDKDKHRLRVNGENVELTPSQWNLFSTLAVHGNRAVSREYLLNECLAQGNRKTRTLDNHMKNLRQSIGSSELIETVRGYGYRLRGEAS